MLATSRTLLVTLLCLPLMGQTYVIAHNPRAVEWSPADISGLHAWWRSDTDVLTDVDGVYEWGDKSGNGRDLTQSTGSKKPAVSSSYLNGHDAIAFDGIDDVLQTAAWTDIEQPNTVFVVAELDDLTASNRMIFDGNDSTDRHVLYLTYTTGDFFYFAGSGKNSATGDTNPHYFVLRFDTTSSYFRMDGVEESTQNPGSQGLGGATAGARYDAAANYIDGQILEAGVVDGALSSGDLTSLESYLADRYNL